MNILLASPLSESPGHPAIEGYSRGRTRHAAARPSVQQKHIDPGRRQVCRVLPICPARRRHSGGRCMHRRCDINPVVVMCWHIAARGSIDQHHERNWSHMLAGAHDRELWWIVQRWAWTCTRRHASCARLLAREDMDPSWLHTVCCAKTHNKNHGHGNVKRNAQASFRTLVQ
jgi:hypothetical protein